MTGVAARRLEPGAWLGVLGGGQLGRMFCAAAQSLGYRVCVLDPDATAPAGAVADEHLVAAYGDAAALDRLASQCAAVTTEFENVPAAALARLARDVAVSPSAASVAVAQDRLEEKAFLATCIDVAPHAAIRSPHDLRDVPDALFPGLLKSARLGYDGKGQARVASAAEAAAAWGALGSVDCILERRLELAREVSVIVCRGRDGAAVAYPVVENEHRHGILAASIVPARVPDALAERARDAALRIAQRLDYVGVLCVEFFVLADGRLVANEMAPRPHNSGHATIEACVASQFEQQARVLAGQPLGDVRLVQPAVMLNILGDAWFDGEARRRPPFERVLQIAGACLHLYGKHEPRRGRKMGHVTVVAATRREALERAALAARALGIEPPSAGADPA
ncbi:MAG TPA: 5-(carboxyamino)imidazole ribonucleotide synthase [Burkholderiaceae bacterium]|nr:5-(carboxyamino)imidazole ribonucleotide synthase [Burkholderiaceae bacterium]